MRSFLREELVRHATRLVELPFGVAALVPELPAVHYLSAAWVDRPVAADALLAALDGLAAGAGLRHRLVFVPDGGLAARLEPALRAAGYERTTLVALVQRRPTDRPGTHAVEDVGLAGVQELTRRSLERESRPFAPGETSQLCEAKAVGLRAGVTYPGVRVDGEVACVCDLHRRGDVAQIEALITLPEHRNRGLARALVLGAAERARSEGARLVFLLAESHDWPLQLYERLGFDRVGELAEFLRTPPPPGGPGDEPTSAPAPAPPS